MYIKKNTQDNFAPFIKACTDIEDFVCLPEFFFLGRKWETIRDRAA